MHLKKSDGIFGNLLLILYLYKKLVVATGRLILGFSLLDPKHFFTELGA